ncbi:MAG TPA: altronate dehydratase family protein, partial [Bacteroidota bacterium]|nr:altronate dehydratase family protein [Bacteroidota bacterium]
MALEYMKIHPKDSVAIAIGPIAQGTRLSIDDAIFSAVCDVPAGHKIAIHAIAQGATIRKYGHVIGHATQPIVQGEWVHAQNMATNLSDAAEYTYDPVPQANPIAPANAVPVFLGYKRADGRVGTRNEIWIINTVGCVNTSAERIARIANERFRGEGFDGVFAFSHPYGCSQLGGDLEKTQALLRGLMQNPNAGGVLVLGLGCENNQLKQFLDQTHSLNDRVRSFNAQDVPDEIEEGVAKVGELFELMKNDKREPLPISALTLGMKCGGSDGFSGITANPLIGCITDRLTGYGGRVILTEVPEMFGAEQQLMNRAVNEGVYRDIIRLIENFKAYFTAHNQPVYENPSPGNKSGGITTLEEKSLGAIQKGGVASVHEVLAYGQPIATPHGMALLNAPGNDGVSGTAMTASGATMILFTTGRGTPLGFPVPTVKISTNTALKSNKPNWIDFDAGAVVDGRTTMENLTQE